ncbi:hypothetical protein [Thermacetogenium phaeum]|nr:hypothetical protein [Thermacetogenium phaeum]
MLWVAVWWLVIDEEFVVFGNDFPAPAGGFAEKNVEVTVNGGICR